MSLCAPPLTPCIGRCTTSTGDAVCRGCGRNLEQIRDWNTYTDDEKRAIMAQLPERTMDGEKDETYATCIKCTYVMLWLQHSLLRVSVPCPRCNTEEQFGLGVYIPEFEGYTWEEVSRQIASKRVTK